MLNIIYSGATLAAILCSKQFKSLHETEPVLVGDATMFVRFLNPKHVPKSPTYSCFIRSSGDGLGFYAENLIIFLAQCAVPPTSCAKSILLCNPQRTL